MRGGTVAAAGVRPVGEPIEPDAADAAIYARGLDDFRALVEG